MEGAGRTVRSVDPVEAAAVHAEQREYYDATDPSAVPLPASAEAAVSAALVPPGSRGSASALDLGCGAGRWTAELAGLYRSVVAVDYSGPRLDAARARVPAENVRWVQADVRGYRPGGPHDLVLAGFLLSHLLPEERALLLPALIGALAPGGAMIVADHRAGAYAEQSWDAGSSVASRVLPDGSSRRVVKDFSALDEIASMPPAGLLAETLADEGGYAVVLLRRQ